jgi:aminomethyltransferase
MSSDAAEEAPGLRTPLYDLHVELGAKMVPFAGYAMPLQYRFGILAEHVQARSKAVFFDVSHMGQIRIEGDGAAELERLVVAEVVGLPAGKLKYTVLTNKQGGIIDDLILTPWGDHLALVVNASRKAVVLDHLQRHLPGCTVRLLDDHALLALQGPAAADVLGRLAPASKLMLFMTSETLRLGQYRCTVSRSGYTGEDGFEIACAADDAAEIARLLLAEPEVAPAGLGARDTLRLEAGLCLWGSDIDETTTPVEAGLGWAIGKRRREQGGFLGDEVILRQLFAGPERRRAGIRLAGKAPARGGTPIHDITGNQIGIVTSGGYAPSLAAPVAMGYVASRFAAPGTPLTLQVRGKALEGEVVRLPFVPHRYIKQS